MLKATFRAAAKDLAKLLPNAPFVGEMDSRRIEREKYSDVGRMQATLRGAADGPSIKPPVFAHSAADPHKSFIEHSINLLERGPAH